MTDERFTMTVTLSVLESLGMKLYSNAAAVLTELVANAYDADANTVEVKWQDGNETIVVSDDGCGMTVEELNDRFLKAGYQKRETEGTHSPKFNRPYMGRKGIGKLSVFSLADRVQVFSRTSVGRCEGFEIYVPDLDKVVRASPPREYHPKPIPVPAEYNKPGTTLVLTELKSKRAGITSAALRKRLARRFNAFFISDQTAQDRFVVSVNGAPIGWADRTELKKLQFIWDIGESGITDNQLPNDTVRIQINETSVNESKNWKVSGWFGTVHEPKQLLTDKDSGSLRNIIVLARGRPIHEGILERLGNSRIVTNYLTGQINADFLDLDDPNYEDIATSDRQRLIEDDERVEALLEHLSQILRKVSDDWSTLRQEKQTDQLLSQYPTIADWIDDLKPWQQKPARKMIDTVGGLNFDDVDDPEEKKKELVRAGVLAFERIALRESSEELQQFSELSADTILPLLSRQSDYEAGLWVDILRSRIAAVSEMQRLVDSNEKERVFQKHLYENLWLLDASWERAVGDEHMEQALRRISPGVFPTDRQGNSIDGRIDIRYATQTGRHVIVELKRYSVNPTIEALVEQGKKYYSAMRDVLTQQQKTDEINKINVVFVLGSRPRVTDRGSFQDDESYIQNQLEPCKGSYFLYDAMIDRAKSQYSDYLDASVKARKMEQLLEALDTPVPTDSQP